MRRRWGHTDQQIAIAFGLSDRSSAAITRLLRKDTIRQADAEDIADALGLHVEMLWPDEVAA